MLLTNYTIYQLPADNDFCFMGSDFWNRKGRTVDISEYDKVYSGYTDINNNTEEDIAESLEMLYQNFNINKPSDYKGRSMSMSDIVELDIFGKIRRFYVDFIGFTEI